MHSSQILIIEPDPTERAALLASVEDAGHEVMTAPNCSEAISIIGGRPVDLVVLEWDMPDCSALEFTKRVRSGEYAGQPRIIVLTDRNRADDKVRAFEQGADDLMTRPYSKRELLARIATSLSRTPAIRVASVISEGRLALDLANFCVRANGRLVNLTSSEFRLLHYLMSHSGAILSRENLIEHVWKSDIDISPRTVDVHIRRLRAALEPYDCDQYVQTVRGIGYRFSADLEEQRMSGAGQSMQNGASLGG